MEMYDVVKKLLGPIEPVGETNTDDKRYKNLEDTITLIDKLLFDINQITPNATRDEASMKKAGKKAIQFLSEIKNTEDCLIIP